MQTTAESRTTVPLQVRRLRRNEIPLLAAGIDEVSVAQLENRWTEQEMGFREVFVAESYGSLIGTVSINQRYASPGSIHLFALEVANQWRSLGVGAAIVAHVVEEAQRRRCGRVYLEVRADNPARRLYHRLGFRRVGDAFLNTWWRFNDDGSRNRIEEQSYRMVKRVG